MLKKLFMLLGAIGAISMMQSGANAMPLIGDMAPEFCANTTMGEIAFPNDFKGHWVVLFSHPEDFTPVCTTEFMAFQQALPKFALLNAKLLGSLLIA